MNSFDNLWKHVNQTRAAASAAVKSPAGQAPAGKAPPKPGGKPTDADKAPKTDSSGLRASDPVTLSSDGGKTGDGTPKTGIDYHLYVHVFNAGQLPSGPFIVKFEVHGDDEWEGEFEHAGLKSGAKVKALVEFGELTPGKYVLAACIYAKDAPDDAIDCAGEFGFTLK